MLLPGFRFRHARADIKRQERRQAAQPEHRPPSPGRQDKTRHHSGKDVPERIAALQYSGKNPAQSWRDGFHRQRSPNAPLAAHPDAIERAHHQEKCEIGRESARQLHHGKENHVGHQRDAPAIPVGHQAENESPDWPHHQRHKQRGDDRLFSYMKFRGKPVNQEDDNKEVERVERPSQKGCSHRVRLARTRKPGHSAVAILVKQRYLLLVRPSRAAKYRDKATRRKQRTSPVTQIRWPSGQGKICRCRTAQRTP